MKNTTNQVEEMRSEENKIKKEVLTTELYFELLKQYAWLSSAIIGAVVFLIQLNVVTFDSHIYMPLGFFCFALINSLFGQDYIVESLIKGKTIYDISKKVQVFRWLSVIGLGLGIGMLSNIIFKN